MTIILLGAAAPGFDRPLEVLEACHARIARQCDTLDTKLARRFIALNRSHLEFENSHVLPLARQTLGAADIVRLGRAMGARRGIPFTG